MSSFSYSLDQINKIFESASRRGLIRKDWLKLNEHDVDVLYEELAEKRKTLKRQLKNERGKDEQNEDLIFDIEEQLEKNIEEKDYVEKEIKEEVLHDILKRNFEIDVKQKLHEDSGKYIYVTGNDRNSFFACKIINDELQKTYKIVQPNRNVILKNLMILLQDKVNKIIVRADIKSFFESIPREKLIMDIEKDGIVSHRSIKLMKRMFYKLASEYGYDKGVPRGISFASSLADIYLRDIDRQISELNGIYFYSRYVDDVIIIASPSKEFSTAKKLYSKIEAIFNDRGLCLHPGGEGKKYMATDVHYGASEIISFDYLGYSITLSTSSRDVSYRLTSSRMTKYKDEIKTAISYYRHIATHNPRKTEAKGKRRVMRRRQPLYRLYKLLGYFTCNYYLGGAKSNILSGIFFKHSLLTDTAQLHELDSFLYETFDRTITEDMFRGKFKDPKFLDKVRKKIRKDFSFEKGFINRRMCHLTSADFKMIKHVLQYEETEN